MNTIVNVTEFRVDFDRIGARREVLPLVITVEDEPTVAGLEDGIARYAKSKLGSRDMDVMLDVAAAKPFGKPTVADLDGCSGALILGMSGRPAGSFQVRVDRSNAKPETHRALVKQPREFARRTACGLAVMPIRATGNNAAVTCPQCLVVLDRVSAGSAA